MQRLITLVSSVAAVTLLVVGCGSDSTSPGAGGSGGSGGGPAVQCVGDYAVLNQDAFTAKVKVDGKCASASDVAISCASNVTKSAEQCGTSCFKSGKADQDACVTTCLNNDVALSPDCVSCYVADVACAREHCLLLCGTAPDSQGCADCREQNNCIAPFYECSGLPLPGDTSVGGNGGSTANAGAAGN